jgi:hypothetical protein
LPFSQDRKGWGDHLDAAARVARSVDPTSAEPTAVRAPYLLNVNIPKPGPMPTRCRDRDRGSGGATRASR